MSVHNDSMYPDSPSEPRYVYDERPPFVAVETRFITDIAPEIGGSATLVYLYLIKLAGSRDVCFPSAQHIADAMSLSINTVRDAIRTLKEQRLVRVEARYKEDGGRTSNNIYILPITPIQNLDNTVTQELTPKYIQNTKNGTPKGVHVSAPSRKKRRTQEEMAADWRPTPEGIQYALEHGVTDINREIENFVLYQLERGNARKDWHAGWRRWCLNSDQFSSRSNGHRPQLLSEREWIKAE